MMEVETAVNNNSADNAKPAAAAGEPKKSFTHGGGRHKRSRNQNRNAGKNVAGQPGNYELPGIVTTNESLFRYYEQQGVIPTEEWEQFKAILPVPLPSSFRIQRSLPERDLLLEHMRSKFFVEIERIQLDGSAPGVDAPKPLPFVPYGFQTEMPRAAVRSHPVLADLHEFLVNETAIGNISRQEAVSMVPPLLLDIQPHHLVLDACASPGSKTMQIVELMHENNSRPEGLVVANDIEYERCYLLVHQTLKRLPTANCVVINEDAAQMPAIVDAEGKPVLYDRILCDVICSSDGTFRKNPEMWTNWDPQKSLHLHKVQQNIARRCIRLLKVGGLMVYSTCSLNPIEDEAVVAHMLRVFNGCLELVDVSDKLPGLRRTAGVSTWKVFNRKLDEILNMDSVPSDQGRNFVPSMFPPTATEAAAMHLERSFRILPHSQNSGGFFVAVFRKTAATSFVDEDGRELTAVRCHTAKNVNAAKRSRRAPAPREDPFIFLEEAEGAKLSAELSEHYGIDPEAVLAANLLVRKVGAERKNAIYYVNERLRDFLKLNGNRLKIVNAGVQLLRRVEKVSRCGFRLCQDDGNREIPEINDALIVSIRMRFVEIVDSDKDTGVRWLKNFESPYISLQLANSGSPECRILIRRVTWDPSVEEPLLDDVGCLRMFYLQALSDVEMGVLLVTAGVGQRLRVLRDDNNFRQYVRLCHQQPGYGYELLAPVMADVPQADTLCQLKVGRRQLVLEYRENDVTIQTALRSTRIRVWRVSHTDATATADAQMTFQIEYLVGKQEFGLVTLHTDQAVILSLFLQSIAAEILREQPTCNSPTFKFDDTISVKAIESLEVSRAKSIVGDDCEIGCQQSQRGGVPDELFKIISTQMPFDNDSFEDVTDADL